MKKTPEKKDGPAQDSFMVDWERGSPMRSFIYYLQRATCGALTFLIIHQTTLGFRLIKGPQATVSFFEKILFLFATPGRFLCQTFLNEVRPLNLPPPLAIFTLNIVIYFFGVWLACYLYNALAHKTFVGPKGKDPFQLLPH
jgi:hypothetical protein